MAPENGAAKSFEVQKSDELGRYIVVSRDMTPGDLVLTETPFVFGPKAMADPETTMPCVGCYKPVFTHSGERCARDTTHVLQEVKNTDELSELENSTRCQKDEGKIKITRRFTRDSSAETPWINTLKLLSYCPKGRCGWPVCSGNCSGLKDPRHHGLECDILSMRPECVLDDMADYYRHDSLLALRCALLQKSNPESWKILLEMQSHMESRVPGTEAYDEANEFIVQYLMNNFILRLDPETKTKYFSEISTKLLHQICGIIDTNALEIRLAEGTELFALYANTCLMEHNCAPNTKHIFNLSDKDKNEIYKIKIKVVIPVTKGDHLSTMYTHVLWGTQARRQHLKDTKFFSCKCQRCSDPTELGTYFSAMKCLGDGNKNCDGIHLPEDPLDDETDWACNKCSVKVGYSQVSMVISQMGEEVENVQMTGGSVTILENLLCRLSTFLHPNHYHLYSIKHSLVQLYGRQPGYTSPDILSKKIKMCKDLIGITKILDPGNARLSLYSAILYHELHSALVMNSKIVNSEGCQKATEEIKPCLIEAKAAIEEALTALKDDIEESSGKKLFSVIRESKENFKRLCKEKKINV